MCILKTEWSLLRKIITTFDTSFHEHVFLIDFDSKLFDNSQCLGYFSGGNTQKNIAALS